MNSTRPPETNYSDDGSSQPASRTLPPSFGFAVSVVVAVVVGLLADWATASDVFVLALALFSGQSWGSRSQNGGRREVE